MSNRVIPLAALALSLLALAVSASHGRTPSPGGGGPEPLAGPDPSGAALESLAARMERIETAVATCDTDLRDRVGKVEARLDALGGEVEERIAEIGKTGGGAEARDLSELSLKDLAVQARMAWGRRDYGAAIRVWKAVLEREPGRDLRLEALRQIGYSHRMLKEHEKEEQVWREVMTLHDADSPEGLSARFNVGWALRGQERHEEALRMMEGYAFAEEIPAVNRRWAQLWVADSAMECGDAGRARQILEGLVAENRDAEDANGKLLLRYAEERLAELDGR